MKSPKVVAWGRLPRKTAHNALVALGAMILPACSATPVTTSESLKFGTELMPASGIELPLAPPQLASPNIDPTEPIKPVSTSNKAQEELTLDEVLQTVNQSFPLFLALQQQQTISSGDRLAREGSFDLNLGGMGSTTGGTFGNSRFDAGINQALPFKGMSFYSGYRLGSGNFPVYYGDRSTANGGELRAGLNLPILRNSPIDPQRARLRQAQIAEMAADPAIREGLLNFEREATIAYWNWVAAGEQYTIARDLLRIAEERGVAFQKQLQAGSIKEFVVIDNSRLIVEREGNLVAAERSWQQASYRLSLFFRDTQGEPILPPETRRPKTFLNNELKLPTDNDLVTLIQQALTQRPELVQFQLAKEQALVDVRLAENSILPTLDAGFGIAQDLGQGKRSPGIFALNRTAVEGMITLQVPLQRRESRGQLVAARAKLQQIQMNEKFKRDQITAEVKDAYSFLVRSFERWQKAREEQKIATRVRELEFDRFKLGQSNLLEVNIRELAEAGARIKVIESLADYYRALAELRRALGGSLSTKTSKQSNNSQ